MSSTTIARAGFARTILMGILACATFPLAQAQLTYTYKGNRLGGAFVDGDAFHGQAFTAKLTTGEIIPNNKNAPLVNGAPQPCPKTWTFTIAVGSTVLNSENAYRSSCYYVSNVGNALLPAFLSLDIQQGDERGGTEAQTCSHIHSRTYEYVPCSPYAFGAAPMTRDPNIDWAGAYGLPRKGKSTVALSKSSFASSGKWSPPKPADITAALLTRLMAMNIHDQGTSLIAQITSVLNDINNGTVDLACRELWASSGHVKAQTGKAISLEDAASTLQWVEYISAGIPCAVKSDAN